MSKFVIIFFLLTVCAWSSASEELKIGVSFTIAPYVIQEEDSGIEIDLIRKIFEGTEYDVTIDYLPLARTFAYFEQGILDAVINVRLDTIENTHVSDTLIIFQNCAIQLETSEKKVERIADLSTGHVIAFQRSPQLLGKEFADAVRQNPDFEEIADQRQQVFRLLLSRNADVVVMERRIYDYHLVSALEMIGEAANKPVHKNCLFPPTDYRLAFQDENVMAIFNRRLAEIKTTGEYDQIVSSYR